MKPAGIHALIKRTWKSLNEARKIGRNEGLRVEAYAHRNEIRRSGRVGRPGSADFVFPGSGKVGAFKRILAKGR